MAPRYSLTIQAAPLDLPQGSSRHAAMVVNTPEGSVCAGFGPVCSSGGQQYFGGMYAQGKRGVDCVPPGRSATIATDEAPNHANVFDRDAYATFTVPISAECASELLTAINQAAPAESPYNIAWSNVFTTAVNGFAGIGLDLLFPSDLYAHLSAISKALAKDPNATNYQVFENADTESAAWVTYQIPEQLRGLQ
jgi:hypothetical protein